MTPEQRDARRARRRAAWQARLADPEQCARFSEEARARAARRDARLEALRRAGVTVVMPNGMAWQPREPRDLIRREGDA